MRLFSTKGKNLEELDHAMFAKSKPGRAGKTRLIDYDTISSTVSLLYVSSI